MCDGPFSAKAVKTYWMKHDTCAELGAAEFLDLEYDGSIHRQHAFFSNGGEVWVNRQTNGVWRLDDGTVLPPYGYYAKTRGTESGVVEKDGVRCGFAKSADVGFYDARKPGRGFAVSSALRAERVAPDRLRLVVAWETKRPLFGYRPFIHICDTNKKHDDIVFQCDMEQWEKMFETPGRYEAAINVRVPSGLASGKYAVRYGAYRPNGGDRLVIDGSRDDGGRRLCGGSVVVRNEGGRVVDASWEPEEADAVGARDRLLGVNRAGAQVDFGGVKTDGSFRLEHPALGAWTVTPLPDSDRFSAEIDVPAGLTVSGVEAVEPEPGAQAPSWRQNGTRLSLAVDSRAFAYRIRFRETKATASPF